MATMEAGSSSIEKSGGSTTNDGGGDEDKGASNNKNGPHYPEEDINEFKKMLVEANTQYEELNRSDRFLGYSDHPPQKSPYHGKKQAFGGSFHSPKRKNQHGHPWGHDPSSRPDGWLGGSGHNSSCVSDASGHSTGSRSPRRSWRPKSAPGKTGTSAVSRTGSGSSASSAGRLYSSSISSSSDAGGRHNAGGRRIPTINLDDSVHSFADEPLPPPTRAPSKSIVTTSSSATSSSDDDNDACASEHGLMTTTTITSADATPAGSAGSARVVGRGQSVPSSPAQPLVGLSIASVKASLKSPMFEKEKIDQKKFLNSFALFERALEATEPQSTQQRVKTPKKSASLMPGAMRKAPSMLSPSPSAGTSIGAGAGGEDDKGSNSNHTENNNNTPAGTPTSSPAKSKRRVPKKATSLISPRRTAARNFKISPRAIGAYDDLVVKSSSRHSLIQGQSTNELSKLSSIIENLRKIKLDPTANKKRQTESADQAAADILAALKKLRHVRRGDTSSGHDDGEDDDVLGRLRSTGVLSQAQLTPDDIDLIRSVRRQLRNVQNQVGSRNPASADLTAVDIQLKQIVRCGSNDDDDEEKGDSKNSGMSPAHPERMLAEISNHLSKVVGPNFQDDQENLLVVQGCEADLKSILDRIRSQDESDLSHALQQLSSDETDGMDGLRSILNGTSFPDTTPKGGANPDEDELKKVIANLNRAKLNKWEASKFAGFLVNLRKTKFPKGEPEFNGREIVQLRKVIAPEKMLPFEECVKTAKKLASKIDDKIFDQIVASVVASAEGEPSQPQHFQDELADAINKLRKVPMNQKEAKEVSQIVFNLRKTPQQEKPNDDEDEMMIELKKVIKDEPRAAAVEDAVKQIKRVRFDLNDEVFEFFVEDIVAMGRLTHESPGDESISTSDKARDKLPDLNSKPEIEVVESPRKKSKSPKKSKKSKSKSKSPKTPIAPESPSRLLSPSSAHSESSAYSDDGRKIVFNRKHHWKHKQHFSTVIGEKRWRKEEQFGADEVIYSPLSREQHDRRKAVSAALKGAMDDDDGIFVESTDVLEKTLAASGVTMGELERNAASSKRTAVVKHSPSGKSPRTPKGTSGKKVPAALPL
mmetsp:Transcript_56426/g.136946  ORF Transcript_56426/g.136946 Transcript_56426/m.136946 type:complete len:1100 (-) Transcript_56426:1416-4715(-)